MSDNGYHVSQEVEDELLALMREGRKIEAIKRLREATGLSLKDAKEAVERFSMDHGMTRHGGVSSPSLISSEASAPGREVEIPAHLQSELMTMMQQGQKIAAIKRLREKTGAGLKEAKEAVERMERGEPAMVRLVDWDSAPSPVAAGRPDSQPALVQDLHDEIADLLASGRKIEAIKRWREATGVGLKQAKEAVDQLEHEYRPRTAAPTPPPPQVSQPPVSRPRTVPPDDRSCGR